MDIEKIIIDLNRYRTEIVNKLSDKNWVHFKLYYSVKDKVSKDEIDNKLKHDFCILYVLDPFLNNPQKEKFFKLLSLKCNSLENILESLYQIPDYREKHSIHLSFGTKLLHTLNNDLPIYDSNIARVLNLTSPAGSSLEAKIKNRIVIYDELKQYYNALLKDSRIILYLKDIRIKLAKKSELDRFEWKKDIVSDTKLLDSLLWALDYISRKMNV